MTTIFTSDGDLLVPTTLAQGRWAPGTMHGPAMCAAIAYSFEKHWCAEGFEIGAEGMIPVRTTIDLCRMPTLDPIRVVVSNVRTGRRVVVSESSVLQQDSSGDERLVARATAVLLRPSDPPDGDIWTGEPLAVDLPDSGTGMASGTGDWTRSVGDHQNAERKRLCAVPPSAVDGEPPTPYVRACVAAEATSLATNLGSTGIGYINCDVTLALSRLPIGSSIGVIATGHNACAGLSVGTTVLFDNDGAFGNGLVTAVSNAHAHIDFTAPDPRNQKS